MENTKTVLPFTDKVKLYFSLMAYGLLCMLLITGLGYFVQQIVQDLTRVSFVVMIAVSSIALVVSGSSFWRCVKRIHDLRTNQNLISRKSVSFIRLGIF